MNHSAANDDWIVPIGTTVVTQVEARGADGTPLRTRGEVGIVVKSPVDHLHRYRVRFIDGLETSLRRGDFLPLKGMLREAIAGAVAPPAADLRRYIVLRCIVGSRAYGLETDDSDTDRRGIYLPPAALHWSLGGVPEQLDLDQTQECYWELGKFVVLALKANPTVLECLYSPLVEHASPIAAELLASRSMFLSRLVYQTYNAYVLSQFRKMQRDLATKGDIKWKHAMHLVRLMLCGIGVLRDGFIPVRVDEHRERLLAIRRGKMPFEEIERWRTALEVEFHAAFERTALPERPDYAQANAFLVRARRLMVDEENSRPESPP